MRLNQSFFPIQFSICFSPKIFILIFRSIRFDSRPQFNFNQTNRLQQQKKYQTVYRITKIPKYLKKNHKYRKKKTLLPNLADRDSKDKDKDKPGSNQLAMPRLSVCADAQKVDRAKLAQTEFNIIEFDPDTFRVLLDYLHTGTCPLTCVSIPGKLRVGNDLKKGVRYLTRYLH